MKCPALVLSAFLASGALLRAGEETRLEQAVNFSETGLRWSVSAGVEARSIGADFRSQRSSVLDGSVFGPGRSSDPGLYRGGSGSARYQDGETGPDYNRVYAPLSGPGGDAVGIVGSRSQVSPGVRQEQTFGLPIAEVSFHSAEVVGGGGQGYSTSDSDVGASPYINLAYAFSVTPKDSFSAVLGWSYVQSDPGAGLHILDPHGLPLLRHTYVYDYDQGSGTLTSPGARFPFDARNDPATAGYIIYNPALYSGLAGGDGYRAPREYTRTGVAAVTGLRATLNEVSLAARFERVVAPWLRVGVTAGPTLNVVDRSLDSQVAWYVPGQSAPVETDRWHNEGTKVKMGFMGQLSLRASLTPRLFVEAHGGYRWVDDDSISAGPAAAKLDLSSWTAGLGVGVCF